MGPPIGVLPRNATVNSAATRPRISGAVSVWRTPLAMAVNAIPAAPTGDEDEQLEPEGGRQRRRDQRGAEGEGGAEHEPLSGSSLVRADERADDGADAHGRVQDTERVGAAAEGLLGEQRQDDLEVERQCADHRREHEDQSQGRRRPCVPQALAELPLALRDRLDGEELVLPHGQERDDGGRVPTRHWRRSTTTRRSRR